MGKWNMEETELKRVCLFVLLLKNKDGGVFATYLKRLKGSGLFDE